MTSDAARNPAGQPEHLDPDSPARAGGGGGSGRRLGAVAGVTLGVAAAVGLGGWGALALLSGGSQPADAIPASAVAYLSVDLDPSASQKVEAFRILKKFPALETKLDLNNRDDLRRIFFEELQDSGVCAGLDYTADIEPWVGDRLGVAAVPGSKGEVVPVLALQVTDKGAAEAGVEALTRCTDAGAESLGYAFLDDYVLVSGDHGGAEKLAAEAAETSLADDGGFQKWTNEVGDPGVVTMYASSEAPSHLASMQVPDGYQDFEGSAGVVRFEGGAVELEIAGGGRPVGVPTMAEQVHGDIATLPAGTGAALSMSLPPGWVKHYFDQMSAVLGDRISVDDTTAALEMQTGLELPEDIESLLGDSVAVAVASDIDLAALSRSETPSDLPAGVRVQGDPDDILPVVDKIKANFGRDADLLVVESSADAVAMGFDPGYVQSLLERGDLGDKDSFVNVVPNAEEASGALYLDFDASGGWADQLADILRDGEREAGENLEPLDALGASMWSEGDTQHGLFRLTTD